MIKLALICVSLLLGTQVCEGYKVLVFFGMPGRSHGILGNGIVKNLLEAGHEVTYVSLFPKGIKQHANFTEIDASSLLSLMPADALNINKVINGEMAFTSITEILGILITIQGEALGHEKVQKLLKDPAVTFDVVIAEWMFFDTYAALAAIYNCPFIWFSSVDPFWMVLRLIDEIPNPAYNPDGMSNSVLPFSFVERVKELFTIILTSGLEYFMLSGISGDFYHKHLVPVIKLQGKKVPNLVDLQYNASLVLGNSDVSMGHSIRLPQNYKTIGGFHIEPEVKPLPEDLNKLLNNAKHGLIYFSMGTNLKSKDMPTELKDSLLKMFGGLKQTVLWKFEEDLPGRPSNVHIVQWAPQQSILAHPNCVMFITHGGLLSATETIHFGKPIIGIPVFGDQYNNVDRAVNRGFAKRVDLSFTMAEELNKAIHEILTDPRYSNKAKELSFIYHHRPLPPGKELVHWVEHVVATQGASHLRSPALFLPWYQKVYLDLVLAIISVLYALKVLLKLICAKICNKTDTNKKRN